MNLNHSHFGGSFFGRCGSVYALCALLAGPALAQDQAGGDNQVKVTDHDTVDISVQDTELTTVLQMLSIEAKKNIITSKDVTGTVSANLYDVTFEEALKAILDVNGFTYYEEGNFIYVVTKEEFDAMEKARRKTESRIFELEHLSAADANEFILPLLSEAGKASARGDVQPGIKPDVGDAGGESYAFTAKLVVNDYPENLDAIAALLGELDHEPQQVLVEATILQTTLDEANAFGVDFSVIGSMNFTDLTNPLSAVNNLINGGDAATGFQPADNQAGGASTSVGNTPGPGGLKVGIVQDDIAVFLRVLDEVADSTVLARPKVMALNRQRAQVLVGARVGYLSTTATETTTTQSVEFLDTGIELVFRPFISKDGMIRMELSPSVSEASLRTVTDANGLIVTIPDELTNELTTNVRIKDGETLVLGGLFKDNTRVTRRQVPILGDIPVVGAAFRGQDDSVERSEIIFLITPSVVRDETLWAIGDDHMNAVDSARVGARSGLLGFSREKMTHRYNQQAWEAFHAGDHDLAQHHINKSLQLAPDQPEMIRLREQVTGEKARVHERSLMQRVFEKQMAPAPEMAPTGAMNQSGNFGGVNAHHTSGAQRWSAPVTAETTMSMVDESSSETDEMYEDSYVPQEITETAAVDQWQDDASTEPQASNSEWSSDPFYQDMMHDFFIALGMPDMASIYTNSPQDDGSGFPFTTFDDVTSEIVGADESHNPMN